MSGDSLRQEDVSEFDDGVNEVRKLLKEADAKISSLAKDLNEIDNIVSSSLEEVFKHLDKTHAELQEMYNKISAIYDKLKSKYNKMRDLGIELIENQIIEIRQKKNDLIQLGFKIDDSIKNSIFADTLLELRQKEVLLFNAIEDCYHSAMLVTSRIKNMDSKANLLGYEYAEFTGKLYGLNNTLIVVGNLLEAKIPESMKSSHTGRYTSKFITEKKGESDFYIR